MLQSVLNDFSTALQHIFLQKQFLCRLVANRSQRVCSEQECFWVFYVKTSSREKCKYFGHVTRHNGLETTMMQGIVAGKSRGTPRKKWEKDITDTFGTMAAASRVAVDRHEFAETSGHRINSFGESSRHV